MEVGQRRVAHPHPLPLLLPTAPPPLPLTLPSPLPSPLPSLRPQLDHMDQQSGTFDSWGALTLTTLSSLLRDFGSTSTGLMWLAGYEYHQQRRPLPYFTQQVVGFREVEAAELRTLGIPGQWAFHYTSIMADMTQYLPFLHREFERLGGTFVQGEAPSLTPTPHTSPTPPSSPISTLLSSAHLLINCTGLGARTLIPDPHVHPIRGYLVRVTAPFLHTWYRDSDSWTYIFPRMHEVNLGGTYDVGCENRGSDERLRREIVERCARVVPELRGCRVVGEWSGLRPGRDVLRLELELPGGGVVMVDEGRKRLDVAPTGCAVPVIHNYGAGGSGMTIHWGTAAEVVQLARKIGPPDGRPQGSAADTVHGFASPRLGEENPGLLTAVKNVLAKL